MTDIDARVASLVDRPYDEDDEDALIADFEDELPGRLPRTESTAIAFGIRLFASLPRSQLKPSHASTAAATTISSTSLRSTSISVNDTRDSLERWSPYSRSAYYDPTPDQAERHRLWSQL